MENNYCGTDKTSASKFIPYDIHIKLHIQLIFCLNELDIRELIICFSQFTIQKVGHKVARFQSYISLP